MYKTIIKSVVFGALITAGNISIAQDLTITQGGETMTIQKKQSHLMNFNVNGNSHFVTRYMESATLSFYIESYTDNGSALAQTKLEIPVGTFNNSFGIDDVVGVKTNMLALVEHLNKEAGKNTLTARVIDKGGKIGTAETELMFMPFEKMMNSGYYEAAVSEDQLTLAISGQMPYVKDQSAKFKIALFDKDLNQISSKEITLPGEDTKNKSVSIKVGNDGTVYLVKRTMNKIGETMLTVYHVSMTDGKLTEFTLDLTAPSYIYTYTETVNAANELIIAGTYYNRQTVSTGEKKASGIFYFTTKNKTEKVFNSFPLDTPVELLTARKILVSGNTVFLAAEQYKEDRMTPPASAAGTAAALDYSNNYIHKNEYIIGMDMEGKRKFELNLGKDFTARDFDHQYYSAYFLSNGKFTVIYNDQRQKYTTDSGYSYTMPVLVQVTTDGLMQPAVPFMDKAKLPYDHILYPGKYVQSTDNSVNMLMRKNETSKFVKVTLN